MKRIVKDYLQLLVIAGGMIALDQWTKDLVRKNLPFGEIWSPADWLTPYARIVHWKNTGAAFGMMQGYGIVFTVLAFLVAGAIVYYYPQISRKDWYLRLAMGLMLAGALGNVIDRLAFGQVTDFISIGNFAVFNIADASITVGVAILLIGMWWNDRHGTIETHSAPSIGLNHPLEKPDTDKKP